MKKRHDITNVFNPPKEVEEINIAINKYVETNGISRAVVIDTIDADGILLKEYIDDIGSEMDPVTFEYVFYNIHQHVILITKVFKPEHNFLVGKKIVAEVAGACLYEIYLTDSQTERMDKPGAFWGEFLDEMVEE